MTETYRRWLAAALVAAGVCLSAVSMAADDIGLGSQNGTFGRGQVIGLTIGLTIGLFGALVGGGLWFAQSQSHLLKRALIVSLVAAIGVWVAFVVLADPTVCPECSNPNRPESARCGPDLNPTTLGNFSYPTCEL